MSRGGQAVVVVFAILAILLMSWQYQQQVASIHSSFERQAEAQVSHIMASVEREMEVIASDIFEAVNHLESYESKTDYIDLKEIVSQAGENIDLVRRFHQLQKTVALHELLITQRGEVIKSYSLLSGGIGDFDVIHIQKHYEWLSQSEDLLYGDKRPAIISSTSDRKKHHIYYSTLLAIKTDEKSPVMVTAMIGIEQLQRQLPVGYYLKLDGIKYYSPDSRSRAAIIPVGDGVEYAEPFDSIGNHKLWGEWRVGISGVNDDHYLISSVNASQTYRIEVIVVFILALISILALEYSLRVRRSLLRSHEELKASLVQREEELEESQENSRAMSHDLLESELKLHSIINVSTDGVIICDDSGVITNINQAVKKLFGYLENDIVGKNIDFLFPEYSSNKDNKSLIHDCVEENSTPKSIEINALSKDNQFIEVELSLTRVKVGWHEVWSVVVRDISERVRNKNEIRDVQENLRAVIDNIAEGIITSDERGVILTFNPAAEQIFGWNAADIIGHNVSELMTGEDKKHHDEHLNRYLTYKKRKVLGVGPREVVGLRKNGDTFYMEIATSEMFSGDKRVFIAIVHDVTERKIIEKNMHMSYSELESLVDSHTEDLKRVNRELVKARDEALVAARSKSEFLAMMSHEIRTPINGVLGMLSLVRDTSLNDEQRDYIESAYASGEILHSLLNDVLDLSKIEAGRMNLDCNDFDIYKVVEKAIHITSKTLHDNDIVISCFISKDVPRYLYGDGGRLRQILSNLISNAVKFTREGGVSVSLSVKSHFDENIILGFKVVDTGIGIEEADAERIFEEFSQADNSERRNYGGSGLGLSICKRFVTMMGGEISVESEPGQGSCFSFTATFKKSNKSESGLLFKPCHVLLLSENNIIKNNFFTQLTDWGCEVQFITIEELHSGLDGAKRDDNEILIVELDPLQHEDLSNDVVEVIDGISRLNIKALFTEIDGLPYRSIIANNIANEIVLLSRPVLPGELLIKVSRLLGSECVGGEGVESAIADDDNAELNGVTILVAEDNVVNQKVIAAMLKKIGVKSDIANNGEEAISALTNVNHGYKLVLMDCQMPVVDGYAATRKIRLLEKEDGVRRIPIIAMTAHALPGDREKCLDAGMDDYLTKPINLEVVKKAILEWI